MSRGRFSILFLRLRGLPVRLWRRVKRAAKSLVAPSRYLFLLKLRARWLGVHVAALQTDMDQVKQYDPIGCCIYCGTSDPTIKLSKEHILAYSLGGDATLPEASCPKCQCIIQPIETYCANEIFRDVTAHHGVHSRSGPRNELPIYTRFSPNFQPEHQVLVPIEDHPGWLMLPSFDPPAFAVNRAPSDKYAGTVKMHCWQIGFDDDEKKKRLAERGVHKPFVMRQINLQIFGRMIAKTAHCTAVAYCGLSKFKPLLKDVILEGKNVPYYVGCATDRTPEPVPMKTWARVEIKKIGSKKYVVVFLRLFAYIKVDDSENGTPNYSVVVGEFIPWWARLGRYIGWSQYSSGKILSPAL
jgi:hypothetical protein